MTAFRIRIFTLLLFFGLAAGIPAADTCHAENANIFIYHRFGESRYPSTNIDVQLFTEHLEYLKSSGKLVLPLSEVVEHLRAGRSLPPETVVLTIDDAFDSFLEQAVPLLRKYRFPATLFVNTDGIGESGYLDWDELRQVVRAGVEIGNHSASHDYLIERKAGEDEAAWRQRVREDIERAQNAFSRELGMRPDLFAYPYGEYSPELVDVVKDIGFSAAVAQQSGVVSSQSDLFTLPRFPMGGPFASLDSFRNKAAMHSFDVEVLKPESPVLHNSDPPLLRVRVSDDRYDLKGLQGFVQGDNRLKFDYPEEGRTVIEARAVRPLEGRRNKYTLTVPLKDGSGWAWFSQPWFRP